MRFFWTFIVLLFSGIGISFSQVVTSEDVILCDGEQGETSVTLTATAFSVDLTDSGIYTDDLHGGVIDMGFDFQFYGNTYNQVVLASNNYLTFNTASANTYSDWTINEAVPSATDPPMNSILCPWQDINPGVNGNGIIAYATIGEEPNRIFIASFCGIPMYSCTDICYSSQIKLFESTNVIETHIAQKVLCSSWNSGYAIHALHNENGTIAHVVTGSDGIERNYPNAWTCENDAWRFTPNGDNDYTLEEIEFAPAVAGTDIIWQDEFGNEIGTGPEIVVVPGGDVIYTAGASMCGTAGDWCGFEGGIEGSDVNITFETVEVSSIDVVNTPCDNPNGGSINVVVEGTGPFTYTWSSNGNVISSENSSSINNLSSGGYELNVSTPSGCEVIEAIFVDTDGSPVTESNAGNDDEICDTEYLLSGNIPLDGESGVWTLVSGEGVIVSAGDANTTVYDLGFGPNTFSWTLENECGASIDEITIIVIDGSPTILSVESLFCLEQIPLIADEWINNFGEWSVVPSEGVEINNPMSNNTFATVSEYGSYVFSFEGNCGADSEVVVMNSLSPMLSGPEEVYCLEAFEINAIVDGDPGYWEGVGPGNITFSDPTSLSPLVTVDDYGVYELFFYGCGSGSSIFVDVVAPTPYIEDPGIIYCEFEAEIAGVSSFNGSWAPGNIPAGSTMSLQSDGNTAFVTVSDYGTYEITFSSCGITDTLNLIFEIAEPYIVSTDHQNCILTIDLDAVTPANTGFWEQTAGPSYAEILNPYSTSTQAVVSEFGLYSFSFMSCESITYFDIGLSCPMTIPNSLTPNGDGVNDLFLIPDLTPNVYTQSVLYIYNTWGAVVYIDPEYGLNGEWWDGKTTYYSKPLSTLFPERYFDDHSGYVNDGVYFYTLEVYNQTNKQKEFYSGDISIFSTD
ncbi:MAG: hypothetical protein CMP62_00195 [Flavobacteriales bacterium]|nr:hypothetical protein [Flavobacteriales bacterium]